MGKYHVWNLFILKSYLMNPIAFYAEMIGSRRGCTISKFPVKLGRVVDTQNGWAATEMGLDRLEIWANRNVMKFNKGKCKALPLGRNSPMHQHSPESGFAEDDLWVLVDKMLNIS